MKEKRKIEKVDDNINLRQAGLRQFAGHFWGITHYRYMGVLVPHAVFPWTVQVARTLFDDNKPKAAKRKAVKIALDAVERMAA